MKATIWALLLCAVLPFTAHSETSTTSTKSTTSIEEKSPLSLEFLISTELTKDTVSKKNNGTYSMMDGSLLYRLENDQELRYFLSTRFITNDKPKENNNFDMFFHEAMYRKKNLLSENRHGIYLESEIKLYKLIDKDIRRRYGYSGALIPQLVFKKHWGRKFSAKLKLRRHFYQRHSEGSYTLDNEDRVYLSGNVMLGRRLSVNTLFKYQHKIRKSGGLDYRYMSLAKYNPATRKMDTSMVPYAGKHQELLTLHSGFLYFIDRKSMVEIYAETLLGNSYDQRSTLKIARDELVFGAALYLTAF